MRRVLILGGYGGFGARLSRRLAGDGWSVIVAGRSEEKARRFAASLDGGEGVAADRNGDLAPVFAAARPNLVIDAAGPFQGSTYRVAEACIAARVHYFDLADAREFVSGFGALDGAAKAAGVVAITGASTLPALSSAVVEELARGMETLGRVEMALSTVSAATAGPSVARAVLSYAGQPIPLWRGQREDRGIGAGELRRITFEVEGAGPLTRMVALADVPDLALLPGRLPGRPAVIFRAGNDSALQMRMLWVFSWLVRLGVLKSLLPWAGALSWLQRRLDFLSGDRSAMKISVDGWFNGAALRHSWTIAVEDGDGPEIPVLAAQLLARKLRDGVLQPGASDAGGMLSLAEFRELFSQLALHEEIVRLPAPSLYLRALGDRFALLDAPVREMHGLAGDGGAAGKGTVTRGGSWMAHLACGLFGFPPSGEYDVHVSFAECGGIERWARYFGAHSFTSELGQSPYDLAERFGPLRFHFELPVTEGRLNMVLRRWTAFGIPMPLFLAPKIRAYECADGEDFLFDVAIDLPFIGPVVHYRGTLRRL